MKKEKEKRKEIQRKRKNESEREKKPENTTNLEGGKKGTIQHIKKIKNEKAEKKLNKQIKRQH